jgi:hypothetical protein
MINPCCCGPCCLIDNDFTGEDLPGIEVVSGSFNFDAGTNSATLTDGSIIKGASNLSESGGLWRSRYIFTTTTTKIYFAYADSNNHWRLDCTVATNPFTSTTMLHYELYEVIGGTPEFMGDRWGDHFAVAGNDVGMCWLQGGHIRMGLQGPVFAPQVFSWPNHVTGGNNFRVEAGGDVVMKTLAQYCKGSCVCQPGCMICTEEWGDTFQVEIMDGDDVGLIFTLDRYRSSAAELYTGDIRYWEYYYFATPSDTVDYSFHIDGCDPAGSDPDDTEMFITVNPPGITSVGAGTETFDASDCDGPFDVVVGGVTYRLTPL